MWKEFGVETSVGRKQGAQYLPSTSTPFSRPRNAFHVRKAYQYTSCKSTIKQICKFTFTKIANDQGKHLSLEILFCANRIAFYVV